MSIKEQILELCEEVVKNGGAHEVNCDSIFCDDCPLSSENRKDDMECTTNNKATVKIAKEYINKNKGYYKVREIIENIGLFEVGTRFYSFEGNVLSIGENETIIFEENMNKLDLNLVLEIKYPRRERIVTFEELKVGDVFILRTNKSVDSCQYEIISLVKEGLFVVQYIENNSEKYELFSNENIRNYLSIILIEE